MAFDSASELFISARESAMRMKLDIAFATSNISNFGRGKQLQKDFSLRTKRHNYNQLNVGVKLGLTRISCCKFDRAERATSTLWT